MMKRRIGTASIILLFVAFLIYSCTGVFTKLASGKEFLSIEYLSCLALVIVFMGIYAVMWQVILKRVPLSKAYLFKSITVLFSLIFAYVIFNEEVTCKNIIGAAFIMAGIIVNAQSRTAV